jgi:hypothetical protein
METTSRKRPAKNRWKVDDSEAFCGRVAYRVAGLICWPSAAELVGLLNTAGIVLPARKGRKQT